jgi:hypothetical protein
MLKYLPVFTAFLLLLSRTHVMAQEGLGKAIEADGIKCATALSINGTKFDDANRNAVFDAGERGLAGWIIRLELDNVEISNTTTNETGYYSFTNLGPGRYNVTEDRQSGWTQSVPSSVSYTINLSDKSAYGYNFGDFRVPDASSVSVSHSSVVVRTFKSSGDSDDYGPPEVEDRIRPAPNPTPRYEDS